MHIIELFRIGSHVQNSSEMKINNPWNRNRVVNPKYGFKKLK